MLASCLSDKFEGDLRSSVGLSLPLERHDVSHFIDEMSSIRTIKNQLIETSISRRLRMSSDIEVAKTKN